MTLRILFTCAILAGLAAAPAARGARSHADQPDHAVVRIDERVFTQVERAAARAAMAAERAAARVSLRAEWRAARMSLAAERRADRVSRRIESRLRALDRERGSARAAGAVSLGINQGAIADDPCRDGGRRRNSDGYRHCEVREQRLPAGELVIDAGQNGGIRVEAWDGADVLVRAVVTTHARDEAAARQLAGGVQVQAVGGRVNASGPDTGRREWWSVSYRVSVPRQTNLNLQANNGGITIAGVSGAIQFETTNGGVRLSDLAGQVNGRTSNGGLTVALGGDRWDGEGLDVQTSNGGVTLSIPRAYSAQLETRTVNGGFRFDYPLTLSGELSPRRGISTTLGSGGAPIRVRTTNGGVRLQER